MINDYPPVMENELIYVYVLRYHKYCGNLSLEQTFQDFFDTLTTNVSMQFPSNTKYFLEQIHMEPEVYIEHHSLWSYYRMFLPKQKYQQYKQDILCNSRSYTSPRWRYEDCELDTSTKKTLRYCPICHKTRKDFSDIKIFHQIPGVYTCDKHHCYLKSIPLNDKRFLIKPEEWDVSFKTCENKWLNGISEDVRYVIEHRPNIFVESLLKYIEEELNNRIREKCSEEVEDELREWYKELPVEYQTYYSRFQLERYIQEKEARSYVPRMEYMVLIRVLFGSFKEFVEICM